MLRLRRLTLFALLLVGMFIICLSAATNDAARFLSSTAIPPAAKKVRHEMEMFGDVRVDDYYWLRDDSRSNPEILSYLKEENNYTDQAMSSVEQFEDQLYAEMRSRIKEDDISVPIRRGPYYYYERTLKGMEYVLHCRRLITNDTFASVYDVMPMGPGAPEEHVILDENIKAQGHHYYSIGAFIVMRIILFMSLMLIKALLLEIL